MSPDLLVVPHTWLYAPRNPTLTITSFQEAPTPDGVACTATISVNDEAVGLLHNDGRGGATVFHSNGNPRFGPADMTAFVAACRTHNGGVLAAEWVFEELISSWSLEYAIQVARRTGHRVIRALDAIGEAESAESLVVLNGAHRLVGTLAGSGRDALIAHLTATSYGNEQRWWQVWTELRPRHGAWQDLTHRPAGVPADRDSR
ncbi:hypothetical protein [Cryptosporangium arvum]|uniref:Uncharacterized protein n=1 Tax=Cryptosporangium arvum DSM 44712 TaxID=927661 RepID=A0A010ZTF1_9ACTN|nr:hypothetical protein [Cryptosporangium arvum]EXG81984.1 hypothetical protein CryarDRAFT_3111 [Cryptosporangium arvum DSM 44712]